MLVFLQPYYMTNQGWFFHFSKNKLPFSLWFLLLLNCLLRVRELMVPIKKKKRVKEIIFFLRSVHVWYRLFKSSLRSFSHLKRALIFSSTFPLVLCIVGTREGFFKVFFLPEILCFRVFPGKGWVQNGFFKCFSEHSYQPSKLICISW